MRPVVIGVVGDTGAGKSSCLNALLGEEEVSYAPGAAFTADIEFMTAEEWTGQVRGLWEDLLGEDGQPQIVLGRERNPDARSLHGAAQVVLESVLGRDVVRHPRVTLERLLEERNAATQYLGQTVKVRELEAKKFRKQIGKYVDSNNRREDVATWPLVKVCRIRHSWPVLATGAMLVDLPGVRDANAARGRVAEGYLKKCSAIWVCADITRAVDNKTAKDLLGDSFRRQMMMDGQFGSISFICSKSDNVMPCEVIDGLGVDEVCARTDTSLEEFTALESQILAKQDEEADRQLEYNRSLRATKKVLRQLGDCEACLQVIRELISARGGDFGMDDSLPGGPPVGEGSANETCNDDVIVPDSEEDEEDAAGSSSEEEDEEGLSGSSEDEDEDEEASLAKARKEGFKDGTRRGKRQYKKWGVAQLRQEQRDVVERQQAAVQARRDAEATKKGRRAALDGVKRELQKLQLKLNGICSRARNAYSKEQLKQQFKEGIKAVEGLSAGGSQAAVAADVDLPVFCISARDAQKLEGRCRRDGPAGAFSWLEHTEVPSLREHVHDIARRGRSHAARSLAASLSSFLVATALLLRDQRELNAEVGASVKSMFERQAAALQLDLHARVEQWGKQLEALLLTEGLSPSLKTGAARAEAKALATASHWGDPPRLGGYFWATYKATVKHGGDYTGGVRGDVSFNGDLSAPLLDTIAVDWDNAFGAKVAQHLHAFRTRAEAVLAGALEGMRGGLQKLGLESRHIERLCTQALQEERRRLAEGVEALMGPVGEKQRDLSRDVIKPAVKEHMSNVYAACAAEVGPGQFDRMRRAMRAHVEAEKGLMFKDAQRTMEQELCSLVKALCKGVVQLATAMLARLAGHFSVLWERPPSNEAERAVAVAALTVIAQQAAEVCAAAGAAVSASMAALLAPPAPAAVAPQLPGSLAQQLPQQLAPMLHAAGASCEEGDAAGGEEGEEAERATTPHRPQLQGEGEQLPLPPQLPQHPLQQQLLPLQLLQHPLEQVQQQMGGACMLLPPGMPVAEAQAALAQQQALLQQMALAGDPTAGLMLQQMAAAAHAAAVHGSCAGGSTGVAAADAADPAVPAEEGPAEHAQQAAPGAQAEAAAEQQQQERQHKEEQQLAALEGSKEGEEEDCSGQEPSGDQQPSFHSCKDSEEGGDGEEGDAEVGSGSTADEQKEEEEMVDAEEEEAAADEQAAGLALLPIPQPRAASAGAASPATTRHPRPSCSGQTSPQLALSLEAWGEAAAEEPAAADEVADEEAVMAERAAGVEEASPAVAAEAHPATEAAQQHGDWEETVGGDANNAPACGAMAARSLLAELPLPAGGDGRGPAVLPAIKREPRLEEEPGQKRQRKQGKENSDAEPMVIDLTDD